MWLCPFLPFINDSPENFYSLLNICRETGVKGILNFGIGLTLREGNREYFYRKLDEHFPGLKQKYIQTFRNSYECSSPNNNFLMKYFYDFCRQNNILCKIDDVFGYMNQFPQKPEQKMVQLELFNF